MYVPPPPEFKTTEAITDKVWLNSLIKAGFLV